MSRFPDEIEAREVLLLQCDRKHSSLNLGLQQKQWSFLTEEELTVKNMPGKMLSLLRASIPNVFTQLS